MPNKSNLHTLLPFKNVRSFQKTAVNTQCGHPYLSAVIQFLFLPSHTSLLFCPSTCFSPPFLHHLPLFAGYINAHRLYFICTLTAVWRSSNVSQKAMKCTTMTDSKFPMSGLYLCTMIRTVADYFGRCSAFFPQKGLGKHFFLPFRLHQESFSFCKQLYVTKKSFFFFCYSFIKEMQKNTKKGKLSLYLFSLLV